MKVVYGPSGRRVADRYDIHNHVGPLACSASRNDPEGTQAHKPVDVRQRRDAYVAGGWSQYDPNAKGYTADEIRRERESYLRR